MKPIIVSGNIATGKPSSVMDMLALHLGTSFSSVYNGVLPDSIEGYDLVIWAPDISNATKKFIPRKDKGACMIISKVMREGYTKVDAVSRIFDFHANAVICIYKVNPSRFRFELVDALGNTWGETHSLEVLGMDIQKFYTWSKSQIRMSFVSADDPPYIFNADITLPKEFIELNTVVADKVENNLGARYFGNFSTRCMKLFPSARRAKNVYLFSPRNVDKKRITENDFVVVEPPYSYSGNKYSVDAPVQAQLYAQFDDINFMIHGHAVLTSKLRGLHTTKEYYPCGDLREVEEVSRIFRMCRCSKMPDGTRAVNLKNHGFLITASTMDQMAELIDNLDFVPHKMLRED